MKRFRFSIRLILLVVALVAVICAWQRAKNEKSRSDISNEILLLELQLKSAEKGSAELHRFYGLPANDKTGLLVDEEVQELNKKIEKLKEQLK